MKKQVKFAETRTVHRLHQAEALPRSAGTDELQTDASINFSSGLEINRPPAARCAPQLQHEATIQIPKTMTAAPFLKHSALTPAQKEYLYTVAASYSSVHVRDLIRQHYMNVLHRCIRTGHDSDGGDLAGTFPETEEGNKHRSEVPSRAKQKEKMNITAKNPGKFPPKIPNRRAGFSKTSASKQRNMKKRTTSSPKLRRKSPTRVRTRLPEKDEEQEEDEEDDEGLDESLSECLSSLSIADWDDDTFSDLSQ